MKWEDVKKYHVFKDGSVVEQTHTPHLYDCYKIYYDNRDIILSKDHLLKVNINKLPKEAQEEVKDKCKGNIPVKEDIKISVLGYITKEQEKIIKDYIYNEYNENLDKSIIKDLSETHFECYAFKFPEYAYAREVFVVRIPTEYENQKIDEENYWIPVEGIAYLFNKYGEIEI